MGLLTLMRVVPRYRELPRWLMHFGVADIVLLSRDLRLRGRLSLVQMNVLLLFLMT